ncbi:MAG: right-handed parallel beta-helix repeat-containing protein [Deltaproteobacteria bacterium]|nr:right-handed parallel beta-helix repeat-containing protein [Deltaproteobacteria bacterium]
MFVRLCLCLLVLLPGAALAADLNLGPGSDLPTLIGGVAPGDTVTLADGEYPIESRIDFVDLAGTEGAPIVLRAAEGATPVIVRNGGGATIQITRSSWVRIVGVDIRGGDSGDPENPYNHAGVGISEGSSDILLDGMRIGNLRSNAVGIGDASNVTIRGCEMHDLVNGNGIVAGCSDGNCWLSGGIIAGNWVHGLEESSGIYIHNAGQGNTVRDNVVHTVGSRGIRVGTTAGGAENVVEGNAVWSTGGHGLVANGPSTVRNNIVFDSAGNGIRSDGSSDGFADARITHNTVFGTDDDGVELVGWATKTGCVLANNAVSNANGYAMQAGDGAIDEGNRIVGNVATGLIRGFDELLGHYGPGFGAGDFEDAVNWNYYPVDGSAVLDQGDVAADSYVPSTDFNGAARDGAAPDVGAYERIENTNPGWLVREGFKATGAIGGEEVEVSGCDCEDTGEATGAATAFLPLMLLTLGFRRRRDD